jgi:hypothetical protein
MDWIELAQDRDNIKIDLREIGWDGMDWLRIGTSGRLLLTR